LERQGTFGAQAGFEPGFEALMVGFWQIRREDELICTPFPS